MDIISVILKGSMRDHCVYGHVQCFDIMVDICDKLSALHIHTDTHENTHTQHIDTWTHIYVHARRRVHTQILHTLVESTGI